MNLITPRTVRTTLRVLAIGTLTVALSGPALASHVQVRATVLEDARVGMAIRIPVAARSAASEPVPGMPVVYYVRATFAGVVGDIEIGRAATDETGVATLAYRPRLAGSREIRMEYVPPGDSDVEVLGTSVDVSGGEQLFRSEPGIDIPGLNVGLLMAVLTTVWSILFGVALLLVTIARAGRETTTPESGRVG